MFKSFTLKSTSTILPVFIFLALQLSVRCTLASESNKISESVNVSPVVRADSLETTAATTAPANEAAADATLAAATLAATTSTAPTGSSAASGKLFVEEVRKFASPALDQEIDNLVDTAVIQAQNKKLLDEKEHHYNKLVHVMVASGKDIAELATSYKGFEQSSEAADVVLDEKIKLKSRASVAYARQHQRDVFHAKVVAAMMQLAMARGLKDQGESGAAEQEAIDQLSGLVGTEQTVKTVALIHDWCEHCQVSLMPDVQPIVGPLKLKAESDKIMHHALLNDAVVGEVKQKLHKYNGRSNLARATAKIVNTSLSIAAFSPTFVSPAAQVAWCAYIVTQGGPEEAKLLKEVYLAKRFESRWQMLNEETNLALSGYNTGIYSRNPTLLAFSQFLLNRMSEPVVKDAPAKTNGNNVAEIGVIDLDVAESKPEEREKI